MKKLLFVMDTFPLGGISKSLLALFNELKGKYEIDFLLMRHEGLFLPLIPKEVNLLQEPLEIAFRNPRPQSVFSAFKQLSFGRWLKWCQFSFFCSIGRLSNGLHGQINVMDRWLGRNTRAVSGHYDAAIAYQGGRCIYYLIEKVNADVKIGYVHSDYSASEVDWMLKPSDSKYFPELDSIVTISPKCLMSLHREFPELQNRCVVVENICSPKMIKHMAQHGVSFEDNYQGIRLITMGRFDINTKGIDFAIESCRILKEKGIEFRWYFLGEGTERPIIEKLIKESGVEDRFILLGAKTNPYPFIKDADIYVQPSRYEGKSVALDEVKALAKPVVVTNFSTVYDQFVDRKTALIADMNPIDIANKIENLITNNDLRNIFENNLRNEKVGNVEQADVFTSLLTKNRV